MGGLIPGGGESSSEKRARRKQRTEKAAAENKLKKKKKEEGILKQARGQRRQRAGARGKRVFTSFLGLGDENGGSNL